MVNIDVYIAHRHKDVLALFLCSQDMNLGISQSGMLIDTYQNAAQRDADR
jgi:hypothetical protein